MFQNRQVMITSFGCCWYCGGAPPRLLELGAGKDVCEGMQGDSGIVIEDSCEDGMQNLGGRLVLMLMRAASLVGEVVVVAVGVIIVVVVGVISFYEKRCLSVMEVECLRVGFGLVEGDILDLS